LSNVVEEEYLKADFVPSNAVDASTWNQNMDWHINVQLISSTDYSWKGLQLKDNHSTRLNNNKEEEENN